MLDEATPLEEASLTENKENPKLMKPAASNHLQGSHHACATLTLPLIGLSQALLLPEAQRPRKLAVSRSWVPPTSPRVFRRGLFPFSWGFTENEWVVMKAY